MPVALRPVAVKAPASVAGTGAAVGRRSRSLPGYTGELDVKPSGLAKATTVEQSIPVGTTYQRTVSCPADTKVARFFANAANDAADLDLTVYRYNAAGTALEAVAGQSATGAADEMVTLLAPHGGEVPGGRRGYARRPARPRSRRRTTSTSSAPPGLGAFAADPTRAGAAGPDHVLRRGVVRLAAGRYLGVMEYDGALAPTYVTVSVP